MVSIVFNCDLDLAKTLSDLEDEIFSTSWDPIWIREKINNEQVIYWIKQKKKEAVGYLAIQFSGNDVEILGLGVLKEHRRKGYAFELMTSMMDYFEQSSYKKIFLEVKDSNIKAKRLYSDFKFNRTGTHLNFYKDEDAAIYELSIDNE